MLQMFQNRNQACTGTTASPAVWGVMPPQHDWPYLPTPDLVFAFSYPLFGAHWPTLAHVPLNSNQSKKMKGRCTLGSSHLPLFAVKNIWNGQIFSHLQKLHMFLADNQGRHELSFKTLVSFVLYNKALLWPV